MAHNQDRSSGHLTSGIIHTTASFSCKRPAPLHVAIPLTLTNVHSCDALLATLCGCAVHVFHHPQCAVCMCARISKTNRRVIIIEPKTDKEEQEQQTARSLQSSS